MEALRQISTAPAFKEHEMDRLQAKLKFDVASVKEQPGISKSNKYTMYSQTCIKRSPLGQGHHILKRFN